jgi:hypothetical protein
VDDEEYPLKAVKKSRLKRTEPKLRVSKEAFDKVLGKLIQTKPVKRTDVSGRNG